MMGAQIPGASGYFPFPTMHPIGLAKAHGRLTGSSCYVAQMALMGGLWVGLPEGAGHRAHSFQGL